MNGRKAHLLRKAAGNPTRPAEYEPVQILRVVSMPTYQQHTRVIRSMGARGLITKQTVEKTLYCMDGKTPRMVNLDAKGAPVLMIVPITKPIRLKVGSLRRVYQQLKRLEKRVGIDRMFHQLQKEAA